MKTEQEMDIDVIKTQLFIDDGIIRHQTLLERVMHQPSRVRDNPLFCPEMPWEGPSIGFVAGVYRDEENGGFLAWYTAGLSDYPGAGAGICVITSEDGIHWERPELDLCEDVIGRKSNVLFTLQGKLDGPTVLRDTLDSKFPWKLVYYSNGNLYVAKSPDGLHWEIPGTPEDSIQKEFGDRTTALFDSESEEPFVILSRDRRDMSKRQLVRAIWRIGSRDGRSVSSPGKLVLRPDLEDGPYVEFYQMSAFRYESLYLGLIERYHTSEPPFGDMELTVSRDTRTWNRIRPRTTFFAPPPNGRETGAFDYAVSTPGNSPPVDFGGALGFYYYGGPSFHGDRYMTHGRCMGLAKLRKDGFASLRAGRREGLVETRPFEWPGGRLKVNYRVLGGNLWAYSDLDGSDGWLRTEITDEDGKVLNGYSKNESVPLFRDVVDAEPTWTAAAGQTPAASPGNRVQDLSALTGRRIALRFYLRSGEIYSFRAVREQRPGK